jgi:hypothetical protein
MKNRTATRFQALAAMLVGLMLIFSAHASFAQGKKKAATAKAEPKTDQKNADSAADAPAKDGDDAQTKVKVERGAGGKKVYKIEGEIVIEGKIQKPEAFYVLQKSSINYDWHELKQEFVPKILDSVTKAPF